MHFDAPIPNIKIMFAKVMAWYFIAITSDYCFPSQRKLHCVAVGEFKCSVHGLNLYDKKRKVNNKKPLEKLIPRGVNH